LGSADILTSITGYAERRPGFSDSVEVTPTTFNNLQRLFTWDRTDGTFIEMACDINVAGVATVWKRVIGTDNSFILIYTDASSTPFDFVVSNNTCYFSNGTVAKKWDPINGLSNWGIAIGSITTTVQGAATVGATVSNGFNPWANPSNVSSAVSYSTSTVSTDFLYATNFGFAIPSGNTITGITVTLDYQFGIGSPNPGLTVSLLRAGSPAGVAETANLSQNSSGIYNYEPSTNFLWGVNWTPNDINQSNFGVRIYCAGGPIGMSVGIRNVRITVASLGGPAVTLVAGGFSPAPTTGYQYVFCYGNSNTGHVSSPTPVSALIKPDASHSVQISLVASTDSQVNQIRVFRDVDGTPGTYYELPNSPYPNATANVTDSAPDTFLNLSSIAPTAGFNDPPTPGQQPVYFSGRIWMFKGNRVVFSGLEEIVQGVPEESFPSGTAGNYWTYDQPVNGLAVAGTGNNQTQVTFCGGRVYGIVGNTLDTFQRFLISNRRGCRSLTCIATLGGMVAWYDSSGQIWATEGSSLNEMSLDIRNSIAGINPAQASMTFHVAGRFHWMVFSTSSRLFVYDMDLNQWMPPWSFAAQYVFSGEISPGNYVLQAATATKALQMNPTHFNDNGTTYRAVMQTGLMALVPDFGRRFSYMAMGLYDEPTRTGFPYTIQVTNNGQPLTVAYSTDEDPTLNGPYVSAGSPQDTSVVYNRKNGSNIKQQIYTLNGPAARWIALTIIMNNADQVDQVYEYFVAYKPLGGR